MIKKFGVYFVDNDFHNVLHSLLPAIAKNMNYWPCSKERLLDVLKNSVFGFYLSCQNSSDYYLIDKKEHIETKEYLESKITLDRIFINEELEEQLKNRTKFNHDFYCVTVDDEPKFWCV